MISIFNKLDEYILVVDYEGNIDNKKFWYYFF